MLNPIEFLRRKKGREKSNEKWNVALYSGSCETDDLPPEVALRRLCEGLEKAMNLGYHRGEKVTLCWPDLSDATFGEGWFDCNISYENGASHERFYIKRED